MKIETILDNCNRLVQFYKERPIHRDDINEVSIKGLLDLYSRILDYNGAPSRNLSRLYLNSEECLELQDYMCKMAIDGYLKHSTFNHLFSYNGYSWEVIDEDALATERQRVNLLSKK